MGWTGIHIYMFENCRSHDPALSPIQYSAYAECIHQTHHALQVWTQWVSWVHCGLPGSTLFHSGLFMYKSCYILHWWWEAAGLNSSWHWELSRDSWVNHRKIHSFLQIFLKFTQGLQFSKFISYNWFYKKRGKTSALQKVFHHCSQSVMEKMRNQLHK